MVRKPEESMVETGTDGGGKDLVAAIPDCQILQNSNYLVFFKVNLCLVSQVVNQSTRQASVITRILSLLDAVTQPTHPASFYHWLWWRLHVLMPIIWEFKYRLSKQIELNWSYIQELITNRIKNYKKIQTTKIYQKFISYSYSSEAGAFPFVT